MQQNKHVGGCEVAFVTKVNTDAAKTDANNR